MASSLAIHPKHSDDPFYRYRMETLQLKHEGRGNGVKTILVNLDTVAKDLGTTPHILMRHLKFELGVQGTQRQGLYTLTGTHRDLTSHIYSFVEGIILCASCESPETVLGGHKRKLKRSCKACGFVGEVTSPLRVVKAIAQELGISLK